MNKSILSIALGLLLAAAAPLVLAVPAGAEVKSADKELQQLYTQGQEAMSRKDWAQALERFRRLEERMAAGGDSNVDTAIFWQAYVLVQAKRTGEAKRTIDRLREKYPQSRWVAESEKLLRQDEVASDTTEKSADDRELAEIAVEGLMHAPPERALPLLQKVLAGKQPEKVKRRALFVLSQLESEQAMDVLIGVARNGDPALRGEAIRMLGISGDDKAVNELSTLYKSAGPEEKRQVLQAWLVADRKDLVFAAARDETDAKLRGDAIQLLGAMDATAELKQLLPSVKEPELQSKIIQSLGVAGDVDAIVQLLAGNLNPAARLEAYRAIGIGGGKRASDALVAAYPRAGNREERDAILHGLLIADDAKAMTALYKSAKTKEEKQQILRMLTTLGDDAAIEIIEQELN
ncbi:HEAT repeat protein [Tahibacter aquaticus]|uniref:HEAT repeat protein n=1 Tax=Tahibacter aquaticus TaxID=520092 RepID=A0A4R6YR48_9GAMM|nr:HEAT repeat domain-containing protein [Tahibacter aquaticus]TDR40420.1 HEAT repeat protein [Tahibacter aquaticus]